MKVAFRTDASLQIGTGHVMRCLTLADVLRAKGLRCEFICRENSGNLIEFIRSRGYATHSLTLGVEADTELAHSHWLGATQIQDAESCISILTSLRPDWLIVDHYGLDVQWEKLVSKNCGKIMVIDDLADRSHFCHLLLDQTFGRTEDDYRQRVPADCKLMCGSTFALLRPDFSALREYSLKRQTEAHVNHLLITLGGVDKDNVSSKVLKALRTCSIPSDYQITVVMGGSSPWLAEVKKESIGLPCTTEVRAGVNNMAQIMAESDISIGAAGSTSWEICCLGVPSILICTANNQRNVIKALANAGACVPLEISDLDEPNLILFSQALDKLLNNRKKISNAAARVTKGNGARLVVEEMFCLQ